MSTKPAYNVEHYTEDTIPSAMETVGAKDMPDDAERKGIGAPATRAGISEKPVFSGFVERKKSKKLTSLIPTSSGKALITVLPEQLQSPQNGKTSSKRLSIHYFKATQKQAVSPYSTQKYSVKTG